MHDQCLKVAGAVPIQRNSLYDFINREILGSSNGIVEIDSSAAGGDGGRGYHQRLLDCKIQLPLGQLAPNHDVDIIFRHAIRGLKRRQLEINRLKLPEGLERMVLVTLNLVGCLRGVNRDVPARHHAEVLPEGDVLFHSGGELAGQPDGSAGARVKDIDAVYNALYVACAHVVLIVLQVSK